MAEGAATAGRRSEPYAGNGPAGTFGPPDTEAAVPDQDPPVITGATGAVPVAGGAGVGGGGASAGVPVGMKTPALGAVGATGGVPAGGPACGGAPAPDSIAFIAPDEIP